MKIHFTDLWIYNYGCEAILRGTVEIFSRTDGGNNRYYFPEHLVEYSTKRLSDIENITIIPHSLFRMRIRSVLTKLGLPYHKVLRFSPAELNSADCVLSMGGDVYTLGGGDVPWDSIGIGEHCYRKNIPYILWGATIGPFDGRPDRLPKITEHLKKATLLLARDTSTIEYLKSISIEDNVKRVGDPAFLMKAQAFDCERFLPKENQCPVLGLNLSPLVRRYYPDKAEFVEQIIKTCETVIKRFHISIVLVPHVFAPFVFEQYDDLAFLFEVHKGINHKVKGHVGIVSEDIGAAQMKYLISQVDYYAGARMHSVIAGLSMNVPSIFLAYSMKAGGLSKDLFGHSNWVLNIRDFGVERFCEVLQHLIDEKDQVKSILETEIPKLRRLSMKAGEYVRDVLR